MKMKAAAENESDWPSMQIYQYLNFQGQIAGKHNPNKCFLWQTLSGPSQVCGIIFMMTFWILERKGTVEIQGQVVL